MRQNSTRKQSAGYKFPLYAVLWFPLGSTTDADLLRIEYAKDDADLNRLTAESSPALKYCDAHVYTVQ